MKKPIVMPKKVPLFEGIAENEMPSLLTCLSAVVRTYEKDEFIFSVGEPASWVGIIRSGDVHVVKEDFLGNRTIIAALSTGEIFGEAFACARTKNLPVSAVATTECEIILIDFQKIISTCSSSCGFHSRMIENMLGIVASKNVVLNQKVEIISKRSTREKLIAFLSMYAQRTGSRQFEIPFNRQELADYICVERSAMSAELSKMQKDGLIRTKKHEFELLYIPEE